MQLLLLLRKSSLQENLENSASRLNLLLAWLEDHFADEVNWDAVADQFSLSLRTLHRQQAANGTDASAIPEPPATDESPTSATPQRGQRY